MNILIACEFSGIVRDAFIKKGHNAISCDILPTEKLGPHIQGDVIPLLKYKWDMIIAHPPCTYLCNSGVRWLKDNPAREIQMYLGAVFFRNILKSSCEKICIENPHGYPRIAFRQPDQEVHPYYFGEREMKRTLLWLKNLQLLKYELEDTLGNLIDNKDQAMDVIRYIAASWSINI